MKEKMNETDFVSFATGIIGTVVTTLCQALRVSPKEAATITTDIAEVFSSALVAYEKVKAAQDAADVKKPSNA